MPPPRPRMSHTATTVSIDGGQSTKLLIFGGYNGVDFYDDVMLYDINSNTWQTKMTSGTPPCARYAHTATLVNNQTHIYVFGGSDDKMLCVNDLYCLDIKTWSWSIIPVSGTRPPHRTFHTTNLVGRKLYVFGGRESMQCYNDLHVFNLDSGVWTTGITVPAIRQPLANHATAFIDKYLYIFGGIDGNKLNDSLWQLNIESMQWQQIELDHVPEARHKHTLTTSQDGTSLILIGGLGKAEKCLDL
eukprot:gene4287-5006_t